MKYQRDFKEKKKNLVKIWAKTRLKRPDVLPVVLSLIRSTANKFPKLYPHEILMGDTGFFLSSYNQLYIPEPDNIVLYCRILARVSRSHSQAQETQPTHLSS
jgi:hypothetical protein